MQQPDYYKILGIKFGAGEAEIKTAYRKLSKKFHPDVNAGDEFFEEKFKELQEAYEVLSDPLRREEYLRSFQQAEEQPYPSQQSTSNHYHTHKSHPEPQPNFWRANTRNLRVNRDSQTHWRITLWALGIAVVVIIIIVLKGYLGDNDTQSKSEVDSLFKRHSDSSTVTGKDSTQGKKTDNSVPTTLHDVTPLVPASDADGTGSDASARSHGISISKGEEWIRTKFNDGPEQIEITPTFTIANAKGIGCHAVAYFYSHSGMALQAAVNSPFTTSGGTVAARFDFTPVTDSTSYNLAAPNFTITLPYSELNLSPGSYNLQYRVVLFDDRWKTLASSRVYTFNFKQN